MPKAKWQECLHPNDKIHPGRVDGKPVTVCHECQCVIFISFRHYLGNDPIEKQYQDTLAKLEQPQEAP